MVNGGNSEPAIPREGLKALDVVNFFYIGINLSTCTQLKVLYEYASANSVPAAAVRRRMQVLFGMIGRKESVGGMESLLLNASAQPRSSKGNFYT